MQIKMFRVAYCELGHGCVLIEPELRLEVVIVGKIYFRAFSVARSVTVVLTATWRAFELHEASPVRPRERAVKYCARFPCAWTYLSKKSSERRHRTRPRRGRVLHGCEGESEEVWVSFVPAMVRSPSIHPDMSPPEFLMERCYALPNAREPPTPLVSAQE